MKNQEELLTYFLTNAAQYVIIKKYKKDEIIFKEGDTCQFLYIVNSGQVEMFKITKTWEERIIFILSDGYVLNEEILLDEFSGSSTCCRAFEDTNIVAIPQKIVQQFMKKDSQVVEYILASATYKLKRTYRQLKNSGTNLTIDKKIASKLYRLALDYGIENKGEIYIDISLTSVTLSKMVGAKRETVSRCINLLKKEEIIRVDGDRITISNFVGLTTIFER